MICETHIVRFAGFHYFHLSNYIADKFRRSWIDERNEYQGKVIALAFDGEKSIRTQLINIQYICIYLHGHMLMQLHKAVGLYLFETFLTCMLYKLMYVRV